MLPIISGVGTLTREPEMRYTPTGTPITTFGLAFNEKFKTKQGEQRENVTFVDCTVFGALGEKVIIPYVHKGDKLYIVGKLTLDQWTAQDGTKRSKHSITVENIQLIGGQRNTGQTGYQQPQQGHQQQTQQQAPVQNRTQEVPEIDINEDEIPF